jgi:ethanolamine kinase
VFGNGRVEGFIPGASSLRPQEMGELAPDDTAGAIARELARMHRLSMPGAREPLLWPTLLKFLALAREASFPAGSHKAAVLRAADLRWAAATLDALQDRLPSARNGHGAALVVAREAALRASGSASEAEVTARVAARRAAYAVVFAHNDVLSGNVLRLGPGRVMLIDYEYGGWNYAGYDIGNHWEEHAGFEFDIDAHFPAPATRAHFLRAYATAVDAPGWAEAAASAEAQAAYLDELDAAAQELGQASHFWWGLWAVLQARFSTIDFDFLPYTVIRFNGLRKQAPDVLGWPSAPLAVVEWEPAAAAAGEAPGGAEVHS